MKTAQLRRYRLDPASYEAWLEWWRGTLLPARVGFGFALEGAWLLRATSEFVWVVSAPLDRAGFERLDAAWNSSPERLAAM